MMQFSRRNFIKGSAAGLALAAMPSLVKAADKAKPQVSVQLYSIRELCSKDLIGTLKAVKAMGYVGVEFAGYYGKSAKDLRKILDDNGLVACGTHTGVGTINPQNIAKTIEFNQEIGNKYLMVPGMKAETKDAWLARAAEFNVAAETAKKVGMHVGYHNHQHEFKTKFDGVCAWETFFKNTSKDVCIQMDVGHVVSAGEDPIKWLKMFPKRSLTLHAKETYPGSGILGQPAAGKVGVKWDEVFAETDAQNVTAWYIVESEANAGSLDSVRGCFEFLKAKGRV